MTKYIIVSPDKKYMDANGELQPDQKNAKSYHTATAAIVAMINCGLCHCTFKAVEESTKNPQEGL